jgi:hypothetical protein
MNTISIKKDVSPSNFLKNDNMSNGDISRRFKTELDVSNIITLEQEVNDDLLINQKDDKFLLSSLVDDDPILTYNFQQPNLSSVNIINNINNAEIEQPSAESELDVEEILDDKWTVFSR